MSLKIMVRKFRIGGVPEHFNIPFELGLNNGIFKEHHVEIEFVICPGGTGEMIKKLNEGELDIAIGLTEGLVTTIAANKANFKIASLYTTSPLTWAVSTGIDSKIERLSDLDGKRMGISRVYSGSHIMSFLVAKRENFSKSNSFLSCGNFQNLRQSVNSYTSDAFLWEKFMTKSFYDARALKYIGEITAPWPAFCIAVHNDRLCSEKEPIRKVLQAIYDSCRLFQSNEELALKLILSHYVDSNQDAKQWFSTVSYSQSPRISLSMLNSCLKTLYDLNVIPRLVDPLYLLADHISIPDL
eukprot:Sdes_comp20636_c0_seq1m15802